MPYTTVGSLTHGSKFHPSREDRREPWLVRRHTEDYSFVVKPDGEEVMLGSGAAVYVPFSEKNATWILASEVGAWSVRPPLYSCFPTREQVAADLQREASE